MSVVHWSLFTLALVNSGCVETNRSSTQTNNELRDSEESSESANGNHSGTETPEASPSPNETTESAIPIQTCFEGADTGLLNEEPQLCDWLNSIDVIVIGKVASLTPSRAFHSVSYSAVRDSLEALRSLGLEDQFPWIDLVLNNKMNGQYHVVDSCPDGLSGSNERWKLTIREFPTLSVGLDVNRAIKGVDAESKIEFFVGVSQLQLMNGPALTRDGVEQDQELAPGTVLGVPLTRSAQGPLALGFQVPFEVDKDSRISVQESCSPKMPHELNGLTIASLGDKLNECEADDASVAAGQALREERVRRISAPLQPPHFAARCGFHVDDVRPDGGT